MSQKVAEMMFTDGTLTLPDGRSLGYSDIGAEGASPVLYLHGNPGSRTEMRRARYVKAFVEAGLRVIAIDRPGYGDSDPPKAKGHTPLAADVRALMQHLALERAVVVGHSRGTLPAISLGVLLSDRVGAVGVFGPTGLPDDPILLKPLAPDARLMLSLVKSAPLVARGLLHFSAWLDRRFPQGAVERMARVLPSPVDRQQLRSHGAEFVEALAQGMRRDPGFAIDDWRSWLVDPLGFDPANIRVPLLLWTGSEDRTCPPQPARDMAARIPAARFTELPGIGHLHTPELLVDHMKATIRTARESGIPASTN